MNYGKKSCVLKPLFYIVVASAFIVVPVYSVYYL